jgi:hypothetical protein
MADIENPSPIVAAATAEPSRHPFRAWYERFLIYDGTPRNGADAEVARAEPVQRSSRRICICLLGVITLLVLAISVILLVIDDQRRMVRPLRVAANVLGIIGLIIAGCLLNIVTFLTLACLEEFHLLQRILDLLL